MKGSRRRARLFAEDEHDDEKNLQEKAAAELSANFAQQLPIGYTSLSWLKLNWFLTRSTATA